VKTTLKRLAVLMFALVWPAVAVLGCATDESHGGGVPNGSCTYDYPIVELLYPAPGATTVPVNVGVLVYQGTYRGTPLAGSTSPASVPIALGPTTPPAITTVPTSVPSPFPSPAATPYQPLGGLAYAVSLPTLSPSTRYQVFATQNVGGCIQPGQTVQTNIGSFTTQ
jgi:hypothetical protein